MTSGFDGVARECCYSPLISSQTWNGSNQSRSSYLYSRKTLTAGNVRRFLRPSRYICWVCFNSLNQLKNTNSMMSIIPYFYLHFIESILKYWSPSPNLRKIPIYFVMIVSQSRPIQLFPVIPNQSNSEFVHVEVRSTKKKFLIKKMKKFEIKINWNSNLSS